MVLLGEKELACASFGIATSSKDVDLGEPVLEPGFSLQLVEPFDRYAFDDITKVAHR